MADEGKGEIINGKYYTPDVLGCAGDADGAVSSSWPTVAGAGREPAGAHAHPVSLTLHGIGVDNV
jgi:hypothetical protein